MNKNIVTFLLPCFVWKNTLANVVSENWGYHHPVTLIEVDGLRLLIPSKDNFIGNHARLTGTYDPIEKEGLVQLVKPGGTVIEIGSNFGPYAVHLARRLGSEGFLYCFEPFRTIFQILTANIALNGFSNVQTFNMGLSNLTESSKTIDGPNLNEEDNYGAASLLDGDRKPWILNHPERQNVTITSLDASSFNRRIDLIKIDAEGMEFEIIKGGEQLIRRDSPILYVENSPYSRDGHERFEEQAKSLFNYTCERPAELLRHNIVICQHEV